MIDPVSAAGAAGALAEITGSMSGMSMAQAYEQKMTDHYDPYDPTNGLQIGYGNKTRETPAISGDTTDTIVDSSESDPQEAWLDWMHQGGLVDSTTGGAVIGSTGDTINYSLMETTGGTVQAVQPVAIDKDTAIVAIAQVLGVSMKISEVDPVLGGKMAQALVAAGVVYDKARNLFTCWWDGINMLFPKKAVQAVEDLFEEEGIGQDAGYTSDLDTTPFTQPIPAYDTISFSITGYDVIITVDNGGKIVPILNNGTFAYLCASSSGYIRMRYIRSDGRIETNSAYLGSNFTYQNKTVRYASPSEVYYIPGSCSVPPVEITNYANPGRVAWTIFYGTPSPSGYPEGMQESNAPSYKTSDLVEAGAVAGKKAGEQAITGTPVVPISLPEDPADTTASTENPTGSTNPERTKENEKEAPIPLPIPKPTESDPTVELTNPAEVNAEKIDEIVGDLANTVDPQPPQSTGLIPIPPFMPGIPVDPDDPSAGSQFPTIVPSSGSGFIHVYNPTPAEFVAFGHWLWVTYADATIDKIWNNPFDGVLGAHELYATPGVSGRDNIRSGFLVCPTSANLVPNRYTEIDCGTVVVPEFYGNYLDYSPYSQCYIYLPFIGINEVSIDDIVGHAVNIRYRVDSYSGACIAMIYVAKQGYRNLCYQFAGNCAVEVPLAGGSQAAIKAGMMQAEAYGRATVQSAQIQKTAKIGTGIVQGAHAGAGAGAFNPVAGIVGGLLGGLAGGAAGYIQGAADYGAAKLSAGAMQEAARVANKSSVQHSGQFGASHGAMGLKVPFIMVRNPIQVKVTNYNNDYGFPAHKRVIIGGCTGYLRVKEVNVVSAHATNEEKIAIEEALKNGVYVS
ncbi:MAG: hypothetical protein IIY21_27165 [Clostridiales bacterium]|nr:hypothetical protein [Clostridiales bacterium]